jgi:hypothetical protein
MKIASKIAKKQVTPPPSLTPLNVKASPATVKKGDIPVLHVAGDAPSRYNEAAAVYKQAEGVMAELKPEITPLVRGKLYQHNSATPWDPIKSVKLEDDKGSILRVTWINKYSTVAASVVITLFRAIKTVAGLEPNVNDFFARTMRGKFNSNAFLGPDGRFSQANYEAITEAMDRVAKELGIENPLTTEEVVVPLADFDARRWVEFDEVTNAQISEQVPNQVNFVPQPNQAE